MPQPFETTPRRSPRADKIGEQADVVGGGGANRRHEPVDQTAAQRVVLTGMHVRELPADVALDHLVERGRRHDVVGGRERFGVIEGGAEHLARQPHAGGRVQLDEAIQPMQAVAVERAAHVEKNGANHLSGSAYHSGKARLKADTTDVKGNCDRRATATATAPPARGSSARG